MKKVIKSVLLGILGLSMCCFANVKAEAVSTDGLVTAENNVSKEEAMEYVCVKNHLHRLPP